MIKEAKKTEELFDDEVSIQERAKHVSSLIKASKSCVFFTGISNSILMRLMTVMCSMNMR